MTTLSSSVLEQLEKDHSKEDGELHLVTHHLPDPSETIRTRFTNFLKKVKTINTHYTTHELKESPEITHSRKRILEEILQKMTNRPTITHNIKQGEEGYVTADHLNLLLPGIVYIYDEEGEILYVIERIDPLLKEEDQISEEKRSEQKEITIEIPLLDRVTLDSSFDTLTEERKKHLLLILKNLTKLEETEIEALLAKIEVNQIRELRDAELCVRFKKEGEIVKILVENKR